MIRLHRSSPSNRDDSRQCSPSSFCQFNWRQRRRFSFFLETLILGCSSVRLPRGRQRLRHSLVHGWLISIGNANGRRNLSLFLLFGEFEMNQDALRNGSSIGIRSRTKQSDVDLSKINGTSRRISFSMGFPRSLSSICLKRNE